jgi:hypothetical protein
MDQTSDPIKIAAEMRPMSEADIALRAAQAGAADRLRLEQRNQRIAGEAGARGRALMSAAELDLRVAYAEKLVVLELQHRNAGLAMMAALRAELAAMGVPAKAAPKAKPGKAKKK